MGSATRRARPHVTPLCPFRPAALVDDPLLAELRLTIVNRASPGLRDEAADALPPHLPIRTCVQEATLLEELSDGTWRPRATFPLRG